MNTFTQNIYSAQWLEYKRRRRLSWFIVLTYIPGVLLIEIFSSLVLQSEQPAYVAAFIWMIAVVISGNRVISWKCPRCGKPFFATWFFKNPFAWKCLNCGLPKWSLSDPDEKKKA
jgi:hypothetical protein